MGFLELDHKEYDLGCNSLQFSKSPPTFRRNVSLLYLRSLSGLLVGLSLDSLFGPEDGSDVLPKRVTCNVMTEGMLCQNII
jgi:hypothetical protein